MQDHEFAPELTQYLGQRAPIDDVEDVTHFLKSIPIGPLGQAVTSEFNQEHIETAAKAPPSSDELSSMSSSSAVSTAEMDAEWALLEPCLESFCLAAYPGKIESLIVAPECRERVLDEHAEKGMAAIQKCFTTSEGNLMIYRHFHRLRRALRRRIASMVPG